MVKLLHNKTRNLFSFTVPLRIVDHLGLCGGKKFNVYFRKDGSILYVPVLKLEVDDEGD